MDATDITECARPTDEASTDSYQSRKRMLSHRGEPFLFADWMRVLMLHFEVDAGALQSHVPYDLDRHDGRSFITLVAFTMENMRPRIGGKLAAWLLKPIATHDFLNLRTYVRHNSEPGIHFLAEWLPNWLAVQLGPRTFGLPYRKGRISYRHDWRNGRLDGHVEDVRTGHKFAYHAQPTRRAAGFVPCEPGSLDEWLMERYAAFNSARGRKLFFRVWHPAWAQTPVAAAIDNVALLERNWPCFKSARLIGANYSPGLKGVWMGRPHRASSRPCPASHSSGRAGRAA